MIVDNKVADFRYFFYSLLNSRERLINLACGAAQQNLNQDIIKELLLPFPSLSEQQSIAKILSDIDSKIEVNQLMNETLEAVGRAVFKHWFVDFEFPNKEGKSYKSSGGVMVNSELGKIPRNWRVCVFTEVTKIVDCLHSKKPSHIETGPVLLQVFNVGENGSLDLSDLYRVSETVYKFWTRNIEVMGGDCVITNAGRVGAVAQIPEGFRSGIGRNMTAIRPVAVSPTYLLNYLLSKYGKSEILNQMDSGTVLDILNVKGIKKMKILLPPEMLLGQYENLSRPFRALIEINNSEVQKLSEIRDRLLTRLMSGKIRLKFS
jgi:type I restriction enzyme S subunit